MKNNMMKKAVAILLAATLTVPNYAVFAEDNTQVEAEAEAARAAEAAAKAEAERQAAEAAARAEAERQAAEAAAQAEAERQAAEAAAQAEAERQAAEAAAQAEAERQAAEAAQTEAPTEAATEAPTEAATEEQTEAPTEAATEKEEKETEKEYKTSFEFENEEVVIKVKVSKDAKLSKGTELKAKKLEEGSEKYEAAKAATVNSLGSDEEGTYSFYEIRFEKDGAELNVKDEHMDIDVTFKDASSAVQVKDGQAKRI